MNNHLLYSLTKMSEANAKPKHNTNLPYTNFLFINVLENNNI